MPESPSPSFLVDTACDPIVVRIEGRASFQNSPSLQQFLAEMRRAGRLHYVIDFQACSSMDSTFLGVLAGAALELRKLNRESSLVVCRVGERNLELIRNLGLHRLLVVDDGRAVVELRQAGEAIMPQKRLNELENARMVLAAHENLVAVDESNRTKFQDVLSFLKGRVDQG